MAPPSSAYEPRDPTSTIYLHALVLDGVFAVDGNVVAFHPVRRLTREDVAGVMALIARRVEHLLERRELAGGSESSGAPDLWSEEAPAFAAVAAASVHGRAALGPRAGARVGQCGDPPEDVAPMTLGPCHAHVDGFDLHAGLVTRAGQRDRLERLCRYALRPPLAQDRLHVSAEGTIWLTLRHRWADGTTHLRFDPLELLERLAVLTPRPRVKPDSLLRRPGPARRLAGRACPRGVAWCRCLARGIVGGG